MTNVHMITTVQAEHLVRMKETHHEYSNHEKDVEGAAPITITPFNNA